MNVVRRVAVVAAVLPVMGLLGACEGAPEEGKAGADSKAGASASPAPQESEAIDPGAKPLTKGQLEKAAVVAADLKGFKVEKLPASELEGYEGVPSAPKACQAIADMSGFTSRPVPKSVVSVSAGAVSGPSLGTSSSVALLAHTEADAEAVMDALRSAVKKCGSGFKAAEAYKAVKAGPGKTYGDESLSYELVGELDGDEVPMHFTVVRSGSTIAAFYGINLLFPAKGQVPHALLTAQLDKLEKATA